MKIFFVAGEASGDLHASNLIRSLKEKISGLQTMGVGGDQMQKEGMKIVRHIRETNFMGFVEVLRNLRQIRGLFRETKRAIVEFNPAAVVLVDYPGFNIRLLSFLKEQGIKITWYISPQVWAWKKGRVKTLRRYVDLMLVVMPFEKNFLEKAGMKADYVGHPILDVIKNDEYDKSRLKRELGLGDSPVIALLPGSRKQEISRILPVMLKASEKFPGQQVIVAGANTQTVEYYSGILGKSGAKLIMGRTYDVMAVADAAAVTSGTATLETALFGVPQVVCYSANWLSVLIARAVIQVKYISIVNIILNRLLVKELIQGQLTVKQLTGELSVLLHSSSDRIRIGSGYRELRELLGKEGASERAAVLICRWLKPNGN